MSYEVMQGPLLSCLAGLLLVVYDKARNRTRAYIAESFDLWPALTMTAAFLTGSFGLVVAGDSPSLSPLQAWGLCFSSFALPIVVTVLRKALRHTKA